MQIEVVSYNSTSLDDSNFEAWLDPETAFGQMTASVIEVARHKAPPSFVDKQFQGRGFPLHVKLKGTIHSNIATLKSLFDTRDTTLRKLLIQDAADSNKQWYIMCTATAPIAYKTGQQYDIGMYAPDPVWIEETQSSDNWSITASGQTHDVTTAGTRSTPPIFEITPTSAKGSNGTDYFRYSLIYNTLTNAFPNYPLNIVGDLDTSALINFTSVSNQINDATGINDTDVTIDIDTAVGGGLPAVGMGYVDTEQISWTANSGTQLTGVTRGIGGTSAASHLDNAVIAQSKTLANGNDFRVFVNGAEVTRWFGSSTNAFNQATTRC